ncbi:DUF1640-domain-containing protein [Ramicandelaber brevisporus]|nr:DUF1640-domain-containing protein [Ramicandelaber brevisporus]
MECLSEVLDGSLRNMSRTVATRADQDKHIYTYKVDFTQLKSELQMLSRNDVEMMKNEHARLAGELEKLKQKLRDEVSRTQAGVRLDMNLDKGRMRDEQAALEIKVRESDARIENEIANLRTMMETIKFQILQYIIGTMTGAGALLLAYLRMFK